MEKKLSSRTNPADRLILNLNLGASNSKHGEDFLGFCIDYLSEKDMRSKRFVLCDLLFSGLKTSERYSCELENIKKAFEEYSASQA